MRDGPCVTETLPGQACIRRFELCSLVPATTLQGEARWNIGERVPGSRVRIVERLRSRRLVAHLACFRLVADLQVRILQIVECVQSVERSGPGVSPVAQTPRGGGAGEV